MDHDVDETGSSYPIPSDSERLLHTLNSSEVIPANQLPAYHNNFSTTEYAQDPDQPDYRRTSPADLYDHNSHPDLNMPPPITPELDPFTHSVAISDEEEQGYVYGTEDEKESSYANIVLEDSNVDSSPQVNTFSSSFGAPSNPHWGPAPAGRALRRNRTRKRVALTNGNLVIERPIPGRLLGFLPRRGEEEFEIMSYTAATCDVRLLDCLFSYSH
jgi:hypothetical protein